MDAIKSVRESEEVLKRSWRYHITYLKVAETVIDSSADYNDHVAADVWREKLVKDSSLQGRIEAFSTLWNAQRKDMIKSL